VKLNAQDLARRLGGRLVMPGDAAGGESILGVESHDPGGEILDDGLVAGGLDAAGVVVGGLVADGLAIDSRLVRPGQVFAALSAERDGHDFVDAAFAAGAAAALVERDTASDGPWPGPVIVVASVAEALAELAVLARERLFAPAALSTPVDASPPDQQVPDQQVPDQQVPGQRVADAEAVSFESVGVESVGVADTGPARDRAGDGPPGTIRVAAAEPGSSGSVPAVGPSRPDRVVGVTGSVGKTTTKDLLANVLARRFATVASEKSFNNELGVPLTLVNAPDGTEAAVIEMGARGPGHIRYLCELARPTIGVVTVIEGVHTAVMGSIAQIAIAKRELVEHLPADGLAVLNAADPNVVAMAAHTTASVLTFGGSVARGIAGSTATAVGAIGEVHAEDIEVDDELRAQFTLRSPWGSVPVHLGVRGAHNVTNALAAAATGLWLGIDLEAVAAGLAESPASPWRMELARLSGGPTVLNDAYNAGPASMTAAIRSLAALGVDDGGRRVAVLGVMAELGPEGPDEHRRIAVLAAELGIEVLAVGTDLYDVDWVVSDVAAVADELSDIGAGDAVLVKGSRVAGLERVATELARRSG